MQELAGQALGIDEGKDQERGDDAEVEGQGEEHPSGSLAVQGIARVEGCVFEHGRPPKRFPLVELGVSAGIDTGGGVGVPAWHG